MLHHVGSLLELVPRLDCHPFSDKYRRVHEALQRLHAFESCSGGHLAQWGVVSSVNGTIRAVERGATELSWARLLSVTVEASHMAASATASEVSTERLAALDRVLERAGLQRVPAYRFAPGDCFFDSIHHCGHALGVPSASELRHLAAAELERAHGGGERP